MVEALDETVPSGSRLLPTLAPTEVATAASEHHATHTRSIKGKERAVEAAVDDSVAGDSVQGDIGQGGSTETEDDSDQDELDYERERQARIEQNKLLLDSLGFAAFTSAGSSSSIFPGTQGASGSQSSPAPRKKRLKVSAPVYDRSGHVLSLPRPGEKHVVTCVEIPSDRRLKRRIADGEYVDCTHWAEGEERRWRFGWGREGALTEGEAPLVGGVGKRFRWRRWKGLEKELRRELSRRGRMNDADQEGLEDVIVVNPTEVQPRTGVSAYSLIPGAPCHQCRRKSEKPKMTCRNLAPECRAVFCETCCKRYSYFDFDADSRTFICPLCKNCCNCANCIRKRNLAHLLDGKKGLNVRLLQREITGAANGDEKRPAETMEDILAQAVQGRIGVPFDFVRIVDQDKDVVSPELPPEIVQPGPTATQKSKIGRGKKKRALGGPAGVVKKGRKRKQNTATVGAVAEESETIRAVVDGSENHVVAPPSIRPLVVKLRLPRPDDTARPAKRAKEVDSDGDTVGGYSSDSSGSSLTSLHSSQAANQVQAVSRRLPFPPRPADFQPPAQSISINEYLSGLTKLSSENDHHSPVLVSAETSHGPDTQDLSEGLVSGAFSAFRYSPIPPFDTAPPSSGPAQTTPVETIFGTSLLSVMPEREIPPLDPARLPAATESDLGLCGALDSAWDANLPRADAQVTASTQNDRENYTPLNTMAASPTAGPSGAMVSSSAYFAPQSTWHPHRNHPSQNNHGMAYHHQVDPFTYLAPVPIPRENTSSHRYYPDYADYNSSASTSIPIQRDLSWSLSNFGTQAYDPPPYSHSPPGRLRSLTYEPLRPQTLPKLHDLPPSDRDNNTILTSQINSAAPSGKSGVADIPDRHNGQPAVLPDDLRVGADGDVQTNRMPSIDSATSLRYR